MSLIASYPQEGILIISFLVVLVTTVITKFVTDQKRMKELREIQKACQIKLKDNRGNAEEVNKINKQIMDCSMELMKHSFKPMLITFIPLLILAAWMNGTFTKILSSWIWWYILSGLVFSMILRKLLKVV